MGIEMSMRALGFQQMRTLVWPGFAARCARGSPHCPSRGFRADENWHCQI